MSNIRSALIFIYVVSLIASFDFGNSSSEIRPNQTPSGTQPIVRQIKGASFLPALFSPNSLTPLDGASFRAITKQSESAMSMAMVLAMSARGDTPVSSARWGWATAPLGVSRRGRPRFRMSRDTPRPSTGRPSNSLM